MKVSKARAALQQLLASETNPQKRAELASKLADVTHKENLERGRRQRAKRNKPPKPTVPRDDSNDPFTLDDGPTPPPPPPRYLTREQRADLHATFPSIFVPATAPIVVEPEPPVEEAPRPNGFTRVLHEYCEPTLEESYPTAREFTHLRYTDPLPPPGTAVARFSPSGEVLNIEDEERREAEVAEKKRVAAAWDAYKDSIYAREEVSDETPSS